MSKGQGEEAYKILIVDDVPKNIQLVASFLTQAGYQVNFALDGRKAIEHVRNEQFDLVLLDIMMPEMDGYEVCRILKSDPDTALIPIIFLTAKTDDISIARGFESGGVDYIVKPFNPPELLARVKTHVNLRQRERELTTLNQTKDKFLSIIGHDIKTPVANIVSLGELIVHNSAVLSDDEKTELLNDIIESGRQGIWLLENLLSWTRIQTGKISVDPIQFGLKEVLDKNKEFIAPLSLRKSISVEVFCDEKLSLSADLTLFNTIIRNLLSNAVKFTSSGGMIEIRASNPEDSRVCIAVIDNGVGIDSKRLEHIFGRVGQTSTPGTQNEKGSGLGLSLVKELSDLIGAEISVKSEVGIGSTFSLCMNVQG